ncbi:hypothetical protein D9613_002102 [Agrocybe pediades]|uniref:Uncharacterized protein n=1 Tax=Agrocybe pediades TaxID=84607 RepID=A0A8H4R4L6_9AGAR|nr:hypothetical protein D9613_002102 [Agrocybe pediades]
MGVPERDSDYAKVDDTPAASWSKYYMYRVEHDVLRPAALKYRAFFEERPLLAIFTAIFCSLSALPVISFLGFASLTVVTLVAISLSCAFVAAFAIIIGLFFVLAFVLAAAFFMSVFLTLGAISTYLFLRLVVLTKRDGRTGMYQWMGETKEQIVGLTATRRNTNGDSGVKEKDEIELTGEAHGIKIEEQQ